MQKLNWQYKTDLEKAGLRVVKILHTAGFQAFWVGGVIRNFLLKRESDNLDIATDALPDQVVLVLSRENIFVKPIGKQFGSILAIVRGQKIEITTFRREGFYSDNRHPDEVEFIKEYLDDSKRRDFTINALYFDPISRMIYDPTLGLKDLKARILRFAGDPRRRIDEDGLRMLRGVRLATQLGFKLEKNTFAAIKTRAKYIQEISGERVKAELDKILMSENRAEGLSLLEESGLLKFIIPEFEKLKQLKHDAKTFHLEGSIFQHHRKALEILRTEELALAYAVLFHDVGKVIRPTKIYSEAEKRMRMTFAGHIQLSSEIFFKFAKKLHFSNDLKNRINWLILHHDERGKFKKMSETEQIRYMLEVPEPGLLIELWRVDSGSNLRQENGKLVWGKTTAVPMAQKILRKIRNTEKLFRLANGNLIMKYSNLKPGPNLGQKILEVKVEIVLGRIRSELHLKKYL